MGEVFLAELPSGEEVALKRPRGGLEADPTARAHFEREARICSLLRHENIVGLRAFGHDADGPYLALEYVDGCAASALLKALSAKGRHLPFPVIASIGWDCAQALTFAHGFREGALSGVIHRDLSPDNILLTRDGVAKLADFGIARLRGATRMTSTGVVKGKFGYMAPEIFEGHDADPATDLFAFAATLFHLICGVAPFGGKTDAEVMRATLQAQPPAPAHLRLGVPDDLDAWIRRGLAKDRQSRPAIAELLPLLERMMPPHPEARAAVAACLDEVMPESVAVVVARGGRTRTLRARPSPPGWRRRVIVAGAIVAALGLAAARWFTWYAPQPAAPPAAAQLSRSGVEGPAPEGRAPLDPPAPSEPPTAKKADTVAPEPKPAVRRHRVSAPKESKGPAAPAAEPEVTAAAPPAEAAAPTRLWIHVSPWAHVFVDGEAMGTTPLAPFEVSPGTHTVILVNEDLHVRQRYDVDVPGHQVKELRLTLEQAQPERLQDP
jgi:hypothetical protein